MEEIVLFFLSFLIIFIVYELFVVVKAKKNYGNKNDKYITSIYYDLKKEKEILYSIIFTNDIDKILYDKRRILF